MDSLASQTTKHSTNCDLEIKPSSYRLNRFGLYLVLAIVITAVTFFAYKLVLFDFFFMDDFGHLVSLKETINNSSVLVQAFTHHYMNEPFYYRPLTAIIWAIEYFIWGANGLFCRLCSIVCMLLSSLILGLIVVQLGKHATESSRISKTHIIWAVFSVALFDLYPIHVSAVNWFGAQHIVFVTLFYLLSFWCYLSWRKSSVSVSFILSMGFFILALLTEELAVTLPFIIFAFEILCISRISVSKNWQSPLKNTFLVTAPYWFVLAAYFFVRHLVLGTFIVKSSTLTNKGFIDILKIWLHGIQQLLIPVDPSVIAQNSPAIIVWGIIIISALLLSFFAFIMPKRVFANRRLGMFLLIWFFCSLAPASNIFGTDLPHFHLISARVTYLGTVPLCIFLTWGIANFSLGFKPSKSVCTIGGALLLLSGLVLYCNNKAYADIGHRSNQMIKGLQEYYHSMPGDPPVKILGVPQPINTFGIHHMPRIPYLERNIYNCNILDVDDWYIPFGFLKGSINPQEDKINFLYWNEKEQTLTPTVPYRSIPLSTNFPLSNYKKAWQGNELKAVISQGIASSGKAEWDMGGALHLSTGRQSFLDINLAGFPCFPIDFVSFTLKMGPQPREKSQPEYELHFLNNIVQDCSLNEYCSRNAFSRVKIIPTGKEQNLVFPLRNIPNWALGNKCHGLKLLLPTESDIKLLSMSLPEANTIIPIVSGPSVITLNQSCDNYLIHYDASRITACTQVVAEVLGPYQLPYQYKDFETPYSDEPDRDATLNIPGSTPSGGLKILRVAFPGKGTYKARMRALDKNEKQVGLAGDQFFINVE